MHVLARIAILCLLILLAAATAVASQAVQAQPIMRDAFTPDFHQRDVATMTTVLGLTADQQPIVEELLAVYLDDFQTARRAAQDTVAEHQPAPSAERAAQARIAEQMRELLEDMRREAEQAADADERARIIDDYQERIRKLRESLLNFGGPDPGESLREARQAMEAAMYRWLQKKADLRNEFTLGIRTILTEEQEPRWPTLERRFRREKTLHHAVLGGEGVDLVRVAGDVSVDLDEAAQTDLESVLLAYEVRLDSALDARNRFVIDQAQAMSELIAAGNTEAVIGLRSRAIELHRIVRDVNGEYAPIIAAVLPGPSGEDFVARVHRAGFPRLYSPSRAGRMLQAAIEQRRVPEEILEQVRQLRDEYELVREQRTEDLRLSVWRKEPQQRISEIRAELTGERSEDPDPVREAYASLREFDDEWVARLKALLGEDAFNLLPGATMGGPQRGDGRFPDREALIDRFDTDDNGRLDEGEREALREYLRRQRGDG